MKRSIFLLFIPILLWECQTSSPPITELIDSIPESPTEAQKTIVAQLSGKMALADGSRIKSRWSPKEREQTRYYLKDLLREMGIEPYEHTYRYPNLNPAIDMILDPFKGTNVYGILPAASPNDEYIVLGAHYDSGKRQAPGADDNATGIALIYNVVKSIAANTSRKKNLLVVFFDQEEEEMIGSKAFVNFLQDQSWNIHSVHCFDMVGYDDDGDKAMQLYSPSQSLLEVYRSLAPKYQIPLEEKVIDPVGYVGTITDFDAFIPYGYEVIGAGECFYCHDYSPYKDTPEDTYDKVNFEYLTNCTNYITEIIKTQVTP